MFEPASQFVEGYHSAVSCAMHSEEVPNYAIIYRCKRNLASTYLGRCGDIEVQKMLKCISLRLKRQPDVAADVAGGITWYGRLEEMVRTGHAGGGSVLQRIVLLTFILIGNWGLVIYYYYF
jgi:hypothetical protein